MRPQPDEAPKPEPKPDAPLPSVSGPAPSERDRHDFVRAQENLLRRQKSVADSLGLHLKGMDEVIPRVRKALDLARLYRHRELHSLWHEIAGPELSSRSRVRGFRKGVLTVEIGNQALLSETKAYRGEELLAALVAADPTCQVRKIVFKAGTLPSRPPAGEDDRTEGPERS